MIITDSQNQVLFDNSSDYIEYLYDKFFGGVAKPSHPADFFGRYDMRDYVLHSTYRDFYILTRSSMGIREIENFVYDISLKDIDAIKAYTFPRNQKALEGFRRLHEVWNKFAYSKEELNITEKDLHVVDISDEMEQVEYEVLMHVNWQYYAEAVRIYNLMLEICKKCWRIKTSVDDMEEEELAMKSCEIVELLRRVKDETQVMPDNLLRNAGRKVDGIKLDEHVNLAVG